jgi:hypothetical protein
MRRALRLREAVSVACRCPARGPIRHLAAMTVDQNSCPRFVSCVGNNLATPDFRCLQAAEYENTRASWIGARVPLTTNIGVLLNSFVGIRNGGRAGFNGHTDLIPAVNPLMQ